MKPNTRKLPGDPDFWMFIAIDAAMFSIICLVMSYYRVTSPQAFGEGQALLSSSTGLLNTLILLSSSYFFAKAVSLARAGAIQQAKRLFQATLMCGVSFVLVKCFEYYEVIQQGGLYSTSTFFSYYYSFTGLHLFHVVLGMVGITVCMRLYCQDQSLTPTGMVFIESAGIYWHLVDMIWIFLFLLIYS